MGQGWGHCLLFVDYTGILEVKHQLSHDPARCFLRRLFCTLHFGYFVFVGGTPPFACT